MKITWKPRAGVTGTPVVLGDNTRDQRGPGSKVILSFVPGYQKAAQVAAYPQAAEVTTIGRDNLSTEVSIAVACEFVSYGECSKYLAGLGALLSSEGILEVAHTGGGADSLEGCFTAARTLQQIGSSAIVQFLFIGGAFERGNTR
jgi:hypothetical protein